MSEQSGFFDAHKVNGDWDRTYVSADFARYFSSIVGNGVFANQSNSLQVIQNQPQDMSISVSTGRSWIEGYFYYNDTPLYLPVDLADGVLDRVDLVVNRWSATDRKITTCIKKGTPSVSPVPPNLQWDADVKELQLASILVKGGITAVTQDLITDTRPDTTVCGWVTSLIDQVDTSTLFLQWKAAYDKEYQDTQTYIAKQKALWDEFFNSVSEDIGIIDGSVTTPKLASGAVTTDKINIDDDLDMHSHRITGLLDPSDNKDAVNKKYVDGKHFLVTASLPEASWSVGIAPYTQTVAVSGLLETDTAHVVPMYDSDLETALAQREAWAMVCRCDTGAGSLTFICFEDKPTVNISIQIEVIR